MGTEQQIGAPHVVIAGWALDYPIPSWGMAKGEGAKKIAGVWAKQILSALAAAGYTVARTEAVQNERDYATSLRADLDRAEAAIKAVRELHQPSDPFGECVACTHEIGEGGPPGSRWDCAHSDRIVSWPCPTTAAIDDAFTVVSPPHVRERLAATHGDASAPAVVDDPREILRRVDEMRAKLRAQIDAPTEPASELERGADAPTELGSPVQRRIDHQGGTA